MKGQSPPSHEGGVQWWEPTWHEKIDEPLGAHKESKFVIDYLQERRTATAEQFLERHIHPCLVLDSRDVGYIAAETTFVPAREKPAGEADGPVTAEIDTDQTAASLWRMAERLLVLPICKTGVNLYEDKITVGRVANNDVSLSNQTISRFHAYFRRSEDGACSVVDAGGTNGTFVDWTRLEARQTVSLEDGAKLRFGDVETRYFEPKGFCSYLDIFLKSSSDSV